MTLALRAYQEEGVAFLLERERCILADQMGLGKTAQALSAMRRSRARPWIVVAPLVAREVWLSEARLWAPDLEVLALDRKRGLDLSADPDVLVVNYEQLLAEPRLLALRPQGVVLDEAHRVKNRKAKTTRAAYTLARRARYAWLLTGTPFYKTHELWSLLHIARPDLFRSYWRWVERWCYVEITPWGWKVGECRDPEGLSKELQGLVLRRVRSELQELPERIDQPILLEMSDRQAALYRGMEEEMVAELEGQRLDAPTVLARCTRLRQLAVSPLMLGFPEEGPKLEACTSLSEGQRAVIFSGFAATLRLLQERIPGAGRITGSESEAARAEVARRFRAGDISTVLCTIRAAGEALSLAGADLVIFTDLDWNPHRNEQAVSRAIRPGGTARGTQVIRLLCKRTIDLAVHTGGLTISRLSSLILDTEALRGALRGEVESDHRDELL